MTVRAINTPPDKYKPICDIFVHTIEDMLPDSIDELKLSAVVNFDYCEPYDPDRLYESLKLQTYISVTGVIRNSEGDPWEIAKRRFGYTTRIESAFLDSPDYVEDSNHSMKRDLANIILNIIKFSKTGEIVKDDATGGLVNII